MTDQTTPQGDSQFSEAVIHLVALGASVAANAERAFQTHHFRLAKLGVSKEDMIQAVNIGLRVKGDPHQSIVDMAQQLLVGEGQGGGCCGGSCACEDENSEAGCCGDPACDCHEQAK